VEELFMARGFLIATCLFAIALAGCGTCKKDLEEAKAQISDLTGKNQKLSEGVQRLNTEKSDLARELADFKDRDAALSKELGQVKKSLSNLAEKNEELRKKRADIEAEVSKLKKENADLTSEIALLKKPTESALKPPSRPAKTTAELHAKPAADQPESLLRAAGSPCDAVIEFMRRAPVA
jgi:chromosome segregation ATPase